MITPIQCATMHSGLTEQEVKEKYGWVLRALNEYGSRCAYDFLEGNSPEPAKHKPFIVGNVRDILDELNQGEITFFLFVEKLNAIASKFYEKPSEGASEGISKIREVMNWISQCVDEDHDLEVSEIKMIWNDLSDAISLIESTPHSGEGIAEAVRECINHGAFTFYCNTNNCICCLECKMPLTQSELKEKLAFLSTGVDDGSRWVKVEDGLPEALETVWISNGNGWTTLGCRSDYQQGDDGELIWCWCATNGTIYEEDGKIVAECEEDDWDVRHWRPLPAPPGE